MALQIFEIEPGAWTHVSCGVVDCNKPMVKFGMNGKLKKRGGRHFIEVTTICIDHTNFPPSKEVLINAIIGEAHHPTPIEEVQDDN